MSLAEFWRVTPRETVMFIQAAAWREEGAMRRAMAASWHTADLAGARFAGKMPKFDKFLPPRRSAATRRPRTPKQVAAYLESWAMQFPRKKKGKAS